MFVYWCFTSHATIFQSYIWRQMCRRTEEEVEPIQAIKKNKKKQTNHKATLHWWDAKHSHMRKLFVNLYKTCSFVENRRFVHKTHTISFDYIKNKYDKSKLETEEHLEDYFTGIYIQIYTSAPCSTVLSSSISLAYGIRNLSMYPRKEKYV